MRADALKEADAAVRETIAGMERAHQEAETSLQAKIATAEQARAAADAKASPTRKKLSG
jgi:hypothetical protein